LFPLLLIFACAAPPAAPRQAGPRLAPPPAEVSTIIVPIRTSLAPISAEIEARVPPVFAGTGSERGIDVRYDVARAPIALQMIGAGLHASTTVKYAMEACRGRFPCVSCGFREPRRIAEVTLQTKLDWDPTWRLRSTTRLLPVHYAKPCEVTWFDIDITRRFIAPVVEEQLNAAARIIDRQTPSLTNLKPQAEQIWTALRTPVELAPRTWLVLEPSEVALTPISGSGGIVTSTLVLRAQTRVVIGARPSVAARPLPALRVANTVDGGVRVPFDLQLPYEDASAFATRDFAGKTYKVGDRPLTIESIRFSPAENGRLLVEAQIDYRGGTLRNYRGLVFLEGTPVFDRATGSISLPDLEYSLDRKRRGFLTTIAERAAHDTIRARLRSTRLPLAPRIATLRAELSRALTRTLAPGVMLRGQADTIEPVSVTPLDAVISVRVIATGKAEVEVSSPSPRASAAIGAPVFDRPVRRPSAGSVRPDMQRERLPTERRRTGAMASTLGLRHGPSPRPAPELLTNASGVGSFTHVPPAGAEHPSPRLGGERVNKACIQLSRNTLARCVALSPLVGERDVGHLRVAG